MLFKAIKFFIENKAIALFLLLLLTFWGLYNAPYNLLGDSMPRDPVAVDAIPDIGENQQIVYTDWPGQSPIEIDNQITYPLTSHLLGLRGVRTIRSTSMFGFSSIYVIFEDGEDFYGSRSRILEKLNSMPRGFLPKDVSPVLGPDATGLGQVYWYTLEGRDPEGRVTGGWDLHELRSIQDFYVKNALAATPGISEIASVGGFVREYQIDINPQVLRQAGIRLTDVVHAVRESNRNAGARTLEINNVEYMIRGLGYLESLEDLESIKVGGGLYTPVLLKDVASVSIGPAERRGILDKGGAEVVGGVAIAQFGSNPLRVIDDLKSNIQRISRGLPSKELADGTISKLEIVPFYDRSVLIRETLNTLGTTLGFEILITILVVILMLYRLRVSLIISGLMPVVVLVVFGLMKLGHVDANIVALSGIAIAIGTVVDMGIILTENMIRHFQDTPDDPADQVVYRATCEIAGALLTAGLTTIVSFIPVFSLTGAEGKLFGPLAYTKTAALASSLVIALLFIPPISAMLLRNQRSGHRLGVFGNVFLLAVGSWLLAQAIWSGLGVLLLGTIGLLTLYGLLARADARILTLTVTTLLILGMLAYYWQPLGITRGFLDNAGFVVLGVGGILGTVFLLKRYYSRILLWALRHKLGFLSIPFLLLILGIGSMLGSEKEFMPSLDEGTYLLMPLSMPHSGVTENIKVLKELDMAVSNLPEIESVVGKAGRIESALDPAPLNMYENLIVYKPEYIQDSLGNPIRFRSDPDGRFQTRGGEWVVSGAGYGIKDLVPDPNGTYYRNWRDHIRLRSDIWGEIASATELPGVTRAPRLQPIETRLVMLQTGMRATMGLKIKGPDIESIETFGLELESRIKEVPGIEPASVFADRIVSKPYIELKVNRQKASRYNLSVNDIQELIEVAIGGKELSYTLEGRERYAIRIRYPREMRATPEDISKIFIDVADGVQVPLGEVVDIAYRSGPQEIKSEDGFLVSYLIFDRTPEISESTAVERVQEYLRQQIDEGSLAVPTQVSYEISGNYQNQLHAQKRLSILMPLVLLLIFMILYLQFRSVSVSLMVFSGVAVAFAGGFLLIWLYGQPWFMDFNLSDLNIRSYLGIRKFHLSVAVWVGFIALFGIATDDGVLMASYLKSSFDANRPDSIASVHSAVLQAGLQRIRPCLMTTATTLMALLPILTSTGKGSDVMIPMAIPCLGGMLMALLSLFIVPVLYALRAEFKLKKVGNAN